ncbi:MAG: hypothetical protein IPH64_16245 [Comamonadaceae bacterium]|nr:hypothetical protein [Comamonadaceae bacterium]
MTSHVDLAPTLLALTGIGEARAKAIGKDLPGKDFSELLAAPDRAGEPCATGALLLLAPGRRLLRPSNTDAVQTRRHKTSGLAPTARWGGALARRALRRRFRPSSTTPTTALNDWSL